MSDPRLLWSSRLRLMRLQFVAVLVAPCSQAGLALTRHQVVFLTPAGLASLRERVGTDPLETRCAACALSWWLEVLSTAISWTRASLREVSHRRTRQPALAAQPSHRHLRPDPSSDRRGWADHANLVPAIDRWGYVQTHACLHVSSLSVVLAAIERELGAEPVRPVQPHRPTPVAPAPRHITPAEEEAILRRADEINERIRQLLDTQP